MRTAIERATKHNPNPIDSKAYTLLGLSLFHQERYEEAYNSFYKAIWDGKQQEQGFKVFPGGGVVFLALRVFGRGTGFPLPRYPGTEKETLQRGSNLPGKGVGQEQP